MISIVIVSVDVGARTKLEQSICATIGIEYEIIIVDNRDGKLNIFEAYNVGAERSKYPFICFAHEDIAFCRQNWGNEIIEILNNSTIGLLGVIGSNFYPRVPIRWSHVPKVFYRGTFIQVYPDGHENKCDIRDDVGVATSEVVTVDGCFMATRKQIWEKFKFDENAYSSFHFYDRDYSMQIKILSKLKVVVAHNVLIKHFSLGSADSKWYHSSIIFFNKWKNKLPISVLPHNQKNNKTIIAEAAFRYVYSLMKIRIRSSFLLKFLFLCFKLDPFKRRNLFLLYKYFFHSSI